MILKFGLGLCQPQLEAGARASKRALQAAATKPEPKLRSVARLLDRAPLGRLLLFSPTPKRQKPTHCAHQRRRPTRRGARRRETPGEGGRRPARAHLHHGAYAVGLSACWDHYLLFEVFSWQFEALAKRRISNSTYSARTAPACAPWCCTVKTPRPNSLLFSFPVCPRLVVVEC